MTLVQKLTTGQPDGTPVSLANAGADMVTPGQTDGLDWRTDAGAGGRTGVRITTASASQALRFNLAATSPQMQLTGKVTTPPTTYSGDYPLLAIRHTAGVAERLIWSAAAAGQINFNGLSTTGGRVAAPGIIQPQHQYVVSIITSGASTTAGTATVKFYEVGGTVPVASQSFTGLNTSTNNFAGVDFASGIQAGTVGWVDVQYNDGAGSEIADIAVNTAPTIVTNDRARFIIDRHGSSSNDSGTLTYSIAQTSGTTTTATLLAPGVWGVPQSATENLVYTVTITDSVYGVTTSTATVPQQAATSTENSEELYWDHTANGGSGGWV